MISNSSGRYSPGLSALSLSLCLVGLLSCSASPRVVIEQKSTPARPAVLFAASGLTPSVVVPLLCVSIEGDCLDAVPLDGELGVGELRVAILGRLNPAELGANCEGAGAGLELLEPSERWLLWPADAAPILKAPGKAADRPADQRAITLALTSQTVVLLPVWLMAQVDLGTDQESERIYLVGPRDAATALAAVRADGVALYETAAGTTLQLDGVLDLDGDGRHALLLSERSPNAWASSVVVMRAGKLEAEARWSCGL